MKDSRMEVLQVVVCFIGLFLCSIPSIFTANQASNESDYFTSNCVTQQPVVKNVYLGWPVSITCGYVQLSDDYLAAIHDAEENEDIQYIDQKTKLKTNDAYCLIFDLDKNILRLNKSINSSKDFFDEAFNIYNFTTNTSTNYSIIVGHHENQTNCSKINLHFNVVILPEMTCIDSIRSLLSINISKPEKKRVKFLCEAPASSGHNLHKQIIPNYNVTWYKDCEELPEKAMLQGKHSDQLHIPHVTFEHPGVYTCAVTHNGMRLYVTHYHLCVSQETNKVEEQPQCTKTTYDVDIGDDLIVECKWDVKHFRGDNSYTVRWQKSDTKEIMLYCENHVINVWKNSTTSNAACSFQFDEPCFSTSPSEKEILNQEKYIVMKLKIKKITNEHFGSYSVDLLSPAAKHFQNSGATFRITLNRKPYLTDQGVRIFGFLLLFLVITLLALCIRWKLIVFRFFWRRHFSKFAPDNKLYDAFLSYQFSHEMDKFSQEQTRDVVLAVRDELENLHYNVVDEYRDFNYNGYKGEIAIAAVRQSHRIIIFLTIEYLKDYWSLFALNESYMEMIESEKKIIFILVPGIAEYVKQHSKSNTTLKMVQSAIKTNYVLRWSGKKSSSSKRFAMSLELAMPKLLKQTCLRHTSTSSSVSYCERNSYKNSYKNPIYRSMSVDTAVTDISSSVACNMEFNDSAFEMEPFPSGHPL